MAKRKPQPQRTAQPSPPSPSAPPIADSGPSVILVVGVFIVAGLALYWGALRNPLVFDDRLLRDDFLRYYGASWFKFDLRWFAYATFGWTYDLFGTDWLWYRLGNVLLHATTAVMLFLFLARLFEVTLPGSDASTRPGTLNSRWTAFFGALMFLLHPAAVYGVGYLVERPIVMATLFGLLCLRLFLEGLARKSLAWYLAAAAAYFLAVFSKEHSVMIPAIAAALALLVRGWSVRLLRELAIPFVLFAGIGLLVIMKGKGYLGAPYEPLVQSLLQQMDATRHELDARDLYPLSVINQGWLFLRYLLVWLVPYTGWMSIDLRPSFPTRFLSWPYSLGFAAYLAYALFAVVLIRKGGKRGLLGFGLLYPWLLGLTEMATVRIQEPFVLYRSYLWMSGLTAILPAVLWRLRARWSIVVLGLACMALIPPLLDRLDSFSSATKLWSDVVRKNAEANTPLVERGYHNRGFAYLQARQYPEAMRDFDKAIEINAQDADAYLGRGVLHTRTGGHDKALANLDRAIAIDPRYAEAYAKRCFVKMMIDKPNDALPDCEKAVAVDPRHRDALTNLGVVYAALNRAEEAAASYRRALALEPGNGDANYNYGVLLLVQNRRAEARHHLGVGCEARVTAACELLASVRRAP